MSSSPEGRPTKYNPEFCQKLINHMADGYSYESFAGIVGVARSTIYEWEKNFPEFSDAKKEGLELNLVFWEKQGIDGLYSTTEYDDKGKPTKSKSINATIWLFNMKNRHKWRDKQPDEIDTIVNNNVGALSDEELNQKIEEKLNKLNGKKEEI